MRHFNVVSVLNIEISDSHVMFSHYLDHDDSIISPIHAQLKYGMRIAIARKTLPSRFKVS